MRHYLICLLVGFSFYLTAQSNLGYQKPHQAIQEIADAAPPPTLVMDSKGQTGILLYRYGYKTIDELSEPELKLGGLRINPKANIGSRQNYFFKATVLDINSGKEHDIAGLPENAKLTGARWNNEEDKLAVLNTTENNVELWIVDVKSKKAQILVSGGVNANIGSPFTWMKDDKSLLIQKLPVNKKPLIDRSVQVPAGPTISESDGKEAQNRTYQDLLKNPTDEYNFELLATSELHLVDLKGVTKKWMNADMYDDISISPNGKLIMISRIEKPFSYIVPYSRFPSSTDIYDLDGKLVKNVYKKPLIEDVPKGFSATSKGPRGINWRRDTDADLFWVEALDEGDPAKAVDHRDALYVWEFPYSGDKKEIHKTKDRFSGIIWGDQNTAIVYDSWYTTRLTRTSFINPSLPMSEIFTFNERSSQDIYSDPGTFVTERNKNGSSTLAMDKGQIFLIGAGWSAKGKHPFIDKFDLKTKTKVRLYESNLKERLETITGAIDIRKGQYLSRIEGKSEYPNLYIRDIQKGTSKQITFNKNPYEVLEKVHKEVISYKREDGVDLTATLYLPVGYDKEKKEKMPMLMWAYPREFKDATTASQTTSSPYQFTSVNWGSPLYWVTRGYAVLDNTAFPIIGEGDNEPNDSFVEQLVGNAKAAIDAVDKLGYVDRTRVGVGGHSYGAFMTANLLSHSNLFAAGIARSGAYNRTLTPFGFQAEERSYWDAPEVYNTMSPFMNAHKMKTPILLIHGEDDNNSGTFPLQSERYFNALKGLGATTRLVMLPKESHGYAARESIMHMLWEQDQWLEKYVKNRKVDATKYP
jgi:dipeptidyl aminopeptidase/acylaminoacyl peptidase